MWAPFLVSGQIYGNEWINYSQKYYRIKVANDGIYRIDSLVLAQAGISLSGLDPHHFQVFFHGQEQYIYVQGESDGVFNRNDYIEFYGKHNDGTLDSLVYTGINRIPNPYYSLFSDTSVYYLTWNGSSSNHRLIYSTSSSSGFGGYTAASYFNTVAVSYANNGNSQYFEGQLIPVAELTTSDPRYTPSEGWFFPELDLNQSQTYTLNISNVYTGGPPAFISTMMMGESGSAVSPDHEIQIYSNWSASTPLTDTIFGNNFPQFIKSYSVPASDLTVGGSASLTFKSVTSNLGVNASYVNSTGNRTAVSYIYASYPHDTNMGSASTFMMYLPPGAGANTFFDLTNFNAGPSDTVRFYDFTDHYRLQVYQNGSTVRVLVPNPSSSRQCYITSDNQVYNVSSITPVGTAGTFTSFVPSSRNVAPYIIISHSSLWTGATNYAAFRSNRYNVVLVNIREVYDQFGYGIDEDPLAIKRFCNYAVNNWRIPPAGLFLIGKGIHEPLFRQDTSAYRIALVPSFGYPSSDILLTSGFTNSNSIMPCIPTGRLPAVNEQEVTNYLNKAEIYDTTHPALWKKKIIHFGGGANAGEQQTFLSYLNNYAAVAKNPFFGAYVYTFQKTSQAPIQITLADSVTQLINNGTAVMTFFGHADGNNFDESLDAPSDYNNVGKYPLIIANACFSGDIFQPVGKNISSTSEQFTLDPKGSIAFLAVDDLGVAGELYTYTYQLYNNFSNLMYGKPLGGCIQSTINTVQNTNDNLELYTSMEMTLNGDPAVIIAGGDSLPDYAVNDSSVFFTPSNVTTQLDSFYVNIVVSNLGKAVLNQPVQLTITRYLPGGITAAYNTTFTHLYYQDTAVIKLPVDVVNGVGLNRFYVDVDPANLTHELSKSNNQLGPAGFPPAATLLITSGDVIPVLPYKFAIIPTDTTTLKASTGDPNAPMRSYVFQIDTSGLFTSPWLKSQVVTSPGGVVCALPGDWINTPGGAFPAGGGGTNSNQRVMNNAHNNNASGQNGVNHPLTVNMQEGHLPETNTLQKNAQANRFAMPANNNQKSIATNNTGVKSPTLFSNALNSKNRRSASLGTNNITRLRPTGPPLILTDSNVYYWRVRRDTNDTKDFQWQQSSFQYIKGKTGWAQANYYQFLSNSYNYMDPVPLKRGWQFAPTGRTLECLDIGIPNLNYGNILQNQSKLYSISYKLDITTESSNGCQVTPGVYVAVIDPITLQPWSTDDYNLGNVNSNGNGCSNHDKKFIFWDYGAGTNELTSLKNALQGNALPNAIPTGNYILIWTWTEAYFLSWSDTSLRTELIRLGANPILRSTPDTVPFVFFVQKGNPSSAITLIGRNANDTLHLITTLTNNEDFGTMTSPNIGPALKWDSLSWSQHLLPGANNQDSVRLNIIGVDPFGNTKTLVKGITPAVANMYIQSISTKLYPQLQVVLYTKDAITHKADQMRKWQVFYTPVPEVAVNPSVYTYFHKDTLQAGDSISYRTVVQNISSYPIDSMMCNSWIVDAGHALHYLPVKYTKKLNPGDTTLLTVKTSSAGYYGNNSIWIEVNPMYEPYTRPEQYHFNDIVEMPYYVVGDRTNPLLDVTFDGVHIMNNDIVSPHPNVVIQVMDENKFLALNDTSDFAIFIRNTNNPVAQRVYFGGANPQLTFTPAVLPHNSCRLNYTPTLQDGTYELTVQATDRSGNAAGGSSNNYLVDFQVINKPMISNVLNYPNPFSTSTRFVFTLTGSEMPTYFKIQILTITGRVVKEITEDELGPIHIGNNVTQYAWDGTDRFGDKLANGIYLYHIITSIDGESIDHYSTGADQYFTKGWGKMYIIR
jgi:hypothetical protein